MRLVKSLALSALTLVGIVPSSSAQVKPFSCFHDEGIESPVGKYFRQTESLSCAFASDVNGVIDAGWPRRPSRNAPSLPMNPQEMAKTVAACLLDKGLRVEEPDGKASFDIDNQTNEQAAEAMCACNEQITSRKLSCIVQTGATPLLGTGRYSLRITADDIAVLAHAAEAHCVALLMTTGHMVGITGGSLQKDGVFTLETREPNLPSESAQPTLVGKIGSADATFRTDRYFWTKKPSGSLGIAYPGSTAAPIKTSIIGYILKCPLPTSSAETQTDPISAQE